MPAVTAMGYSHPTNPSGREGLKVLVQLVHHFLGQFEPKWWVVDVC